MCTIARMVDRPPLNLSWYELEQRFARVPEIPKQQTPLWLKTRQISGKI